MSQKVEHEGPGEEDDRDSDGASAREHLQASTGFHAEPFVGFWRDREDMADSTAWVRRLRAGDQIQ